MRVCAANISGGTNMAAIESTDVTINDTLLNNGNSNKNSIQWRLSVCGERDEWHKQQWDAWRRIANNRNEINKKKK